MMKEETKTNQTNQETTVAAAVAAAANSRWWSVFFMPAQDFAFDLVYKLITYFSSPSFSIRSKEEKER